MALDRRYCLCPADHGNLHVALLSRLSDDHSMTSVSLLSIFSGWTFVNTAHSLSAPAVQSQPELSPSLSSNAMPSYRCATNASLVAGGDRLPYSTTPISSNPSLLGRLKRSMSLSRLTKKRTRSRLSTDDESTNQDGTPTLDRPQ